MSDEECSRPSSPVLSSRTCASGYNTPIRSFAQSSIYIPTPFVQPHQSLTPSERAGKTIDLPYSPRGDEYFSELNARPVPLRYTPHKHELPVDPMLYIDELGFELHSNVEKNDFHRFAEHLTQGVPSHRCWRDKATDEWCNVFSQCDIPLDLLSADTTYEILTESVKTKPEENILETVYAESTEPCEQPEQPRSNVEHATLQLPLHLAAGDVNMYGFPASIRPLLWYNYTGAHILRLKASTQLQMELEHYTYAQLLALPTYDSITDTQVVSQNNTIDNLQRNQMMQCLSDTVPANSPEAMQIDLYVSYPHQLHPLPKYRKMLTDINKDLKRTLCAHPLTRSPQGQDAIKRILTAFVYKHPHIGYIQSLNFVAALVLLVFGLEHEEDAFWTFCGLVGNQLEKNYSGEMEYLLHLSEGFQEWLLHHDKTTFALLHEQELELSFRAVSWYLCMFFTYTPPLIAVYLLDVALYTGAMHSEIVGEFHSNVHINDTNSKIHVIIPIYHNTSTQYVFILSTWFHAMRALVQSAEGTIEKLHTNTDMNQFELLQTLGNHITDPSLFINKMALHDNLTDSLARCAKDQPAILSAGGQKRAQTASKALLAALAQHQELSIEQAMQERFLYKQRKPATALRFGVNVNTVSRKKSLFQSPMLSPKRLLSPSNVLSPRLLISQGAFLSPKSPVGKLSRQSNYFFPKMMRSPQILSPILRKSKPQDMAAIEIHPQRIPSRLEIDTTEKDQTLIQNMSMLSLSYKYDDLNISYSLVDTPGKKKKKKNQFISQSSRPTTCEKMPKPKKQTTNPTQADEQWIQYLDIQNQSTNNPLNISKSSVNSVELLDFTQISQLNQSSSSHQ